LDGITITPEEGVKAENFFAQEIEPRKNIFLSVLPEEEFVDRRINKSEFLDPESDSDDGELDMVDTYDNEGNLVRRANSSHSQRSRSKSKSGMRAKRSSGMNSPNSIGSRSGTRSIGFKVNDDVVSKIE
jgi:hypothetical protein